MCAEEKPALLSLPAEPFRYYRFGERTVHLDGHVEVEGAYYSVPPGMIGHRVHVQWDGLRIRILQNRTHELLREHIVQSPGRYRTPIEDRPSRTPPTTMAVLERAAKAGSHIGALCRTIHRTEGEMGIRRMLGILHLAKKHGVGAVDGACQAALDIGVPTYRFVRRFLEHRPSPQLTLRQIDPLIRELHEYRDLIDRMTQEVP
jgi:hypothetical protein